MATTKSDREVALNVLMEKFNVWKTMDDEELEEMLREVMCCNIQSSSRTETIKYLVKYFIERTML